MAKQDTQPGVFDPQEAPQRKHDVPQRVVDLIISSIACSKISTASFEAKNAKRPRTAQKAQLNCVHAAKPKLQRLAKCQKARATPICGFCHWRSSSKVSIVHEGQASLQQQQAGL
eukprot:CAMPEP_0197663576 /NCGR_PEP_ID=MMETSP1338-20131121/57970_1 /TAXON_ID=43686 ORGANISM="Pelagodinium beii, Strain RCC1491" /NCGR_SAMPLE_ID=MMETSP1338 /ASSEMBLY_ACC=CAM_ASM_000754 /LENGTH=114 /DNA_ID=CAMNT_0043242015 /DNA_START=314 /DNA_END=658 /DNA_ORIENTATION=-